MRKTLILSLAAVSIAMVVTSGCNGESWVEIEPGLSYVDSLVGGGEEVQYDSFVAVHYTGWLYDVDADSLGAKFDSSLDRGEPIAFPLGRSMVIQGWEKGLPGMKVGGKRTLLIGPEMGYGDRGSPPVIPGGATLRFDVEILDLPSVEVIVETEGAGPAAEAGDQIAVHYTGYLWENGEPGESRAASEESAGSEGTEAREKELELFIPPGPRLGDMVISADHVRKAYGEPRSLEDVFEVFRRYCAGEIDQFPWVDGEIQAETRRISDELMALNRAGYSGPLSVEWEDSGMDREHGATESCANVRKYDFTPSDVAFDAAFGDD